MNKRVNLIIGSGVLGAYLSAELLKKNEKIIVTSRSLNNKFTNYKYLKIKKKYVLKNLIQVIKKKFIKFYINIIQKKFFILADKAQFLKVSY